MKGLLTTRPVFDNHKIYGQAVRVTVKDGETQNGIITESSMSDITVDYGSDHHQVRITVTDVVEGKIKVELLAPINDVDAGYLNTTIHKLTHLIRDNKLFSDGGWENLLNGLKGIVKDYNEDYKQEINWL